MKPLRLAAALLQRLVDKIDPHEGRYRMLFERSPLPMWVVDTASLRFLAVNDAALRLYEYSRDEFLAMTVHDIRRPEDDSAFRDFLGHAGDVHYGVFRHVKKTGEPIDIDGVGHLVAWRGRPARLVQINDITERLRTQQTLERLNRELEVSHERLRALSRRLFEVQEEERKRLARDLHDDVGQALTALKIQLESIARPGNELTARSRIEEIVDTVQHTLERVRQLSLSLRPPQLDDLGLAAALRSHLDRQARVAGLHAHFEAEDAPQELAPDAETACFRVAQEAINNVLRHARARNLWVRLFTAGGRLAISVRDDGRGFDLDSVRARASNGASLGLVGMEERMALAGGSFELRSAPGQGTVLLATFPVASAGKERAVG
ncbi:MAG TPA: PAS domain-containing sensor histidine kinase [Burkholderiales bacterium]